LNAGSSRAFDDIAADWIWTVQDDERDSLLRRRQHRQRHRRDVRPRAAADLLQVVDEHVDVLQHLRRGGAVFGEIEGVDRDAGLRVGLVAHLLPGLDVAADAVLGGEQGDQLQVGVLSDQVDIRCARTVDAGVIGDEADAPAAKPIRDVVQ
jgi:hypothetical protein